MIRFGADIHEVLVEIMKTLSIRLGKVTEELNQSVTWSDDVLDQWLPMGGLWITGGP